LAKLKINFLTFTKILMRKGNWKYIVILVLLFCLYVLIEIMAPTPVNWNISFSEKDKIPYGSHIPKAILPDIFENQKIVTNNESFYLTLNEYAETDYKNLIIISNAFQPDKYDLENLLEYVWHGNNAFIAAMNFGESFSDTLNFSCSKTNNLFGYFKDSVVKLNFVNPAISKDDGYHFINNMPGIFFDSFNKENTTVLGTSENKETNFIKVAFGSGNFYLNCQPLAFTNYSYLYSNYQYGCTALSYLPGKNTIWDEYYKPGNKNMGSPVRFILSNRSLKAGYYLFLISIIVYIIFEGKRKQRYIPVIRGNVNTSLEFIETIGRLYYHRRDNKDVAIKKKLRNFVLIIFKIRKIKAISTTK